MKKSASKSYRAIEAKALELGLPKRFPTDLTNHDRALCERMGDARQFLWGLGENGTFMVVRNDDAKHKGFAYFKDCFEGFDCNWFAWDGAALLPMKDEEQAYEWFVRSEEDQAAE